MLAPGGGERGPTGAASLLAAAVRVADEVLAPAAARTDEAPVVPRSHLDALAEAGLFGLFGPAELGGSAVAPAVTRQVFEVLAGACGVTFFVWVQHHAPVRLLAGSPNADLRRRLLPGLCTGQVLGGVAFAHLRRPGPPAVVANRTGDGYILAGEAPWVTSWGLAGRFAVAARVGEDGVVFVAVGGEATDQLVPSPPLRLAAMNASATIRLSFRNLRVPESDVIVELSLEEWRARDRVATAQPNPAAFAVAGACTRLLRDLETDVAAGLEDERLALRRESYGLADEGGTDDAHLHRLLDLRAASLELAVRSAHALVVATGGRAMEVGHPAPRLLREAAFYAIQAQTPALREATLRRLQRPSRS